MSKVLDIKIGDRFGSLVVIGTSAPRHKERTYVCRCDCGKEKIATSSSLFYGGTTSCGCMKGAHVREGYLKAHNNKPFQNKSIVGIRQNMISRCYRENTKSYKDYGARGIRICDEWLNNHDAFEKWCFENGWRKGLEIDRIDNDGDYTPSNCRFVTKQENCNNRRTSRMIEAFGETLSLANTARKYNIKYQRLQHLLDRGIPPETAIERLVRNGSSGRHAKSDREA